MRVQKFSFGSIRIDGVTYEHDVVIDRGEVRKRKKKPSKKFREEFGHTPVSVEEKIPWKCRRLIMSLTWFSVTTPLVYNVSGPDNLIMYSKKRSVAPSTSPAGQPRGNTRSHSLPVLHSRGPA